LENKIINACCSSRDCFITVNALIDSSTLSDKGNIIFKGIQDYYAADQLAANVDKELLLSGLQRDYPNHATIFEAALQAEVEVSPPNVAKEVVALQLDRASDRMKDALESGNSKELVASIARYQAISNRDGATKEVAQVYNNVSLEEILRSTSDENRLKLPKVIQDHLKRGPLRGHHISIAARPDGGKSTFGGEFLATFLEQGLRVMYLGNEDPKDDMLVRFCQRILRKDEATIARNYEKAMKVLERKNWSNLYFVEASPGSLSEINEIVEQIRPDVVIIDQIRNVHTGKDHNLTTKLEVGGQFIRNIAKKYSLLAVTITQVGDSGHHKPILDLNDIDGSNTGYQATIDLQIMVGFNHDMEQRGERMLTFPKNKLSGVKEPLKVKIDFDTRSLM